MRFIQQPDSTVEWVGKVAPHSIRFLSGRPGLRMPVLGVGYWEAYIRTLGTAKHSHTVDPATH